MQLILKGTLDAKIETEIVFDVGIRGVGLCTKVHFFALKKLLQKMKEGTLLCT